MQIFIGLFLAVLVSFAAYRLRALSGSGALAAALLGTVIFGLGGLSWAVLLLAFFFTSSGLSRLFQRRKAALEEKFSKGSQRDAGQVLANGGVAGLFVLLHLLFPGTAWPWLGFTGALAAANADTWATELGVLNRSAPRLITTGKSVEQGTSGAISLTGTLAALVGGLLIGVLGAALWPADLITGIQGSTELFILRAVWVGLAGLAGSLVDSLLGATLQAIYFCPACQKETERHPLHLCNTPTIYRRGLPWLNNDWVNGFCTLAGALLAAAIVLGSSNLFSSRLEEGNMLTVTLTTPAFRDGETMPARNTCDAENKSPALAWTGIPDSTVSLAIIADDPDAPVGIFTHWVIYNLPLHTSSLPEGIAQVAHPREGGTQGFNNFRHTGYDGPCPPRGPQHRYYFKLYALDLSPDLKPGLTAGQLMTAMQGHILAQGQVMGRYQR